MWTIIELISKNPEISLSSRNNPEMSQCSLDVPMLVNFSIYMSHFSYVCKMRYLLNLVLESWEYLWSYLTFWVVILDYGLKLHKLSIHTLVMLQKWLEIH